MKLSTKCHGCLVVMLAYTEEVLHSFLGLETICTDLGYFVLFLSAGTRIS
jgi:hypothetical protein